MDKAEDPENFRKGLIEIISENFKAALDTFKELSQKFPDKSTFLLYKAIAEIKLKKYEEAYNDILKAEKLTPNSFEILFQKGVACFYLQKSVEAKTSLNQALQISTDQEQKDRISPWINKVDIEMNENGIYDYNKEVPKGVKVITNWIQTATKISVELIGNQVMNIFNVTIEPKHVKFTGKDDGKIKYSLDLTNSIIPEKSTYKISGMKIMLELEKEIPNFNWVTLEQSKDTGVNNAQDKVSFGFYPTSSKVKKDWNQFDKELTEEIKEDEKKEDGNGGMWNLFRQIYERSDENTRRAMVKSFQTSGGTVLSTNWDEVKNKDYEGKDRPEAPKGQQWVDPEK